MSLIFYDKIKILTKNLGQAQREAVLSPTGEHLGGWNSSPSNVTWPERNRVSLHSTRSVDLGWVNMGAYNFLSVDQSLPSFFSPNVEGVVVDYVPF